MMKLFLLVAGLALFSLDVYASSKIACEVREQKHWNDPGFSLGRKDKSAWTIYYDCFFDSNVVISSPDTKFSNERNDKVSQFNGKEIEKLEYFPTDFVDAFPNVVRIDLYKTSLKSLSKKNFHGLSKLGYLHISNNKISTIEEDTFDDLESLVRIHLEGNKLTSLPAKVFAKLSNLDTLHLDSNQLTSLDAGIFKNNHKLAILILNDNKFTDFAPETFETQTLMRQIWLQNNEISVLNSQWLKNAASLKDADFDNNKFSQIPLNFLSNSPSLYSVSFSRNPISTIDFAMFENNKQINRISFDRIKVATVLNIDTVDTLPRLQGVDFQINDDSCIIGKFHEGTLNKLKQEVKENCKIE